MQYTISVKKNVFEVIIFSSFIQSISLSDLSPQLPKIIISFKLFYFADVVIDFVSGKPDPDIQETVLEVIVCLCIIILTNLLNFFYFFYSLVANFLHYSF